MIVRPSITINLKNIPRGNAVENTLVVPYRAELLDCKHRRCRVLQRLVREEALPRLLFVGRDTTLMQRTGALRKVQKKLQAVGVPFKMCAWEG